MDYDGWRIVFVYILGFSIFYPFCSADKVSASLSNSGVVFKDSHGGLHKAFIRPGPKNEVILSAGALGSPQLLMLSGVGPAPELMLHGIEVVVDQPQVGQGMSDNPMNALFVPSPTGVETSLIQAVGITEYDSFIEAASGSTSTGAFMQNLPSAGVRGLEAITFT